MTDLELKKKLQEWLFLRGEVSALEKAREEYGHSDRQKRIIRQKRAEAELKPSGTTEQFHPEGKLTPIGVLQRWQNLKELRRMPKPSLPKTKKVEIIPAKVSSPLVLDRIDSEHPKEMNSPIVVNSYKNEEGTKATGDLMLVNDIVNVLKRKKHG